MADNIFQKGQKFAATGLDLLKREIKTPGLFRNKLGIADFRGAANDTVMIRRPAILKAREKQWRGTDAIVVDRLAQTKIAVQLNKHPYSAVALTSEEETLDIVNYVREVQQPQVAAIVEYFEDAIVGELRGATYVHEIDFEPGTVDAEGTPTQFSDPSKVALRARKMFNDSYVPTGGRYWIVGSSVSEAIAGHEKLQRVDTSGLPEALREGVVGKLAGFTIIEVQALGEAESYFIHESAIALATVAPVVPQGVAKGGGVAAGNGLAVTQLWDYDGDHLVDRSVVHAFVGAAIVTDPQMDADGIVLDQDGEPTLEFVRAIQVTFAPIEEVEEDPETP